MSRKHVITVVRVIEVPGLAELVREKAGGVVSKLPSEFRPDVLSLVKESGVSIDGAVSVVVDGALVK